MYPPLNTSQFDPSFAMSWGPIIAFSWEKYEMSTLESLKKTPINRFLSKHEIKIVNFLRMKLSRKLYLIKVLI
jgi:hypothetical protein